jgi:predicted nuclease of restriction endonuclease-like (RecB) superfamily
MRAYAQAWPDMPNLSNRLLDNCRGHNPVLLSKLKTGAGAPLVRRQAIEHRWSRDVLVMQIETRLRERSGSAVTNFDERAARCNPTWHASRSQTPVASTFSA